MKGNIMANGKWKWEHASGGILWLLVALLVFFIVTEARADHPIPDPPEGGINYTLEGECEDNETGERGYCYAGYGTDGTFYLTFWQDDRLMFIRRIKPGQEGYEKVWVADDYATY